MEETGILLPKNQRQHRTLHIQKDVLPYALCYLLCPVSAALTRGTAPSGMGEREGVGGVGAEKRVCMRKG